jgi:transcriptional regulator with XRE-family HTH domain
LSDQEAQDKNQEPITNVVHEIDQPEDKKRNPKKTTAKKVRFITISGQKYRFDYEWGALEEDIPKTSYLDREQGAIKVILNSKYRLLNVIKPSLFYIAIYVIEGIVEIFLKENNKSLDKLITIRDKTVKTLADVISEDVEEQNMEKDSQIQEAQNYLLKSRVQSGDSSKLTGREKDILHLRLEEGCTLEKIARQYKLTNSRVGQIITSAVNKINDKIDKIEVNLNSFEESSGKIIDNIAEEYDTDVSELLGDSRNAKLVLPRHLIMYLLRKKLKMSFPSIAKIMQRKNHTTIIHAYEHIRKLITDGKVSVE